MWQLKTTMPHWKTGCKVRLTISKAPTPAMMNTAMTLTVSGITPRISVLLDRPLAELHPQSAQAELERIFSMQYTLTLTEEVGNTLPHRNKHRPGNRETTTEEVLMSITS